MAENENAEDLDSLLDDLDEPEAEKGPAQKTQPKIDVPLEDWDANLNLLAGVPQSVSVVLGECEVPLEHVTQWVEGSLIELDTISGEPVDVLVNGRVCYRGEVVVVAENFGVRITQRAPLV